MKKHELLEKAMRDYPYGTKFIGAYGKEFISSGGCHFWGPGIINNPTGLLWDSETDKWAEIIPESILSDKCTIQVNNERELEIVKKHSGNKCTPLKSYKYPLYIDYYESTIFHSSEKECMQWERKIVSFQDFAAEYGIEVPVFVMTSEDGVPIYVGDEFIHVSNRFEDKWALNDHMKFYASKTHVVFEQPETDKAFSTKEAAEAWIKEHNKPNPIVIPSLHGQFTVTKNTVSFKPFNASLNEIELSGTFFDKIVEARKSLQS